MKTIVKIIIFFCKIYYHHGYLGLISIFYPMYWSQDDCLKNNGYDIVTFKKTGKEYMRTRYFSYSKAFKNK